MTLTAQTSASEPKPKLITVACLDMAGTTVADDGSVIAAFSAAVEQFGLPAGTPGHDEALAYVRQSMGQSKIEVFRRILGDAVDSRMNGGLIRLIIMNAPGVQTNDITTGSDRPHSRTCPSDRSRRAARDARVRVPPAGRCACPGSC